MNWSAEIEEVHRRRRLAEGCGGPDAVARHHAEGKLTVRECIARLLDPGSGRHKGGQGGFIEDLARLGGKVVGVIACNPTHGGVVDVKAALRREIEAAWPGMRTRPGLKARLGVRP